MAIRMFASDSRNDLYLDSSGNIAIITGLQAVTQACEHAMQTILREMVLQYQDGLPDFEVVWNGSPNVVQFEAAARATLLRVPEVQAVTEFEATAAGNVLRYTATIKTQYGLGSING